MSKELIDDVETKVTTTKDVVIVGGMFNKGRDILGLMDKLDTNKCSTLLVHYLEDTIIVGGIATKEWYDKVKDVDLDKKDGEFLIFLDINGPLFKKCSFQNLAKMCEVLDTKGISDMIAKFIKDIR